MQHVPFQNTASIGIVHDYLPVYLERKTIYQAIQKKRTGYTILHSHTNVTMHKYQPPSAQVQLTRTSMLFHIYSEYPSFLKQEVTVVHASLLASERQPPT